jgi:hypothetical protein
MRSLAISIFLMSAAQLAFASSQEPCERRWLRVETFESLPSEARSQMMEGGAFSGDISPAGGPFNAGDVGGGPWRRFLYGATYEGNLLVAVEHGGRGYFVERWQFKVGQGNAQNSNVSSLARKPESWSEFVRKVCHIPAAPTPSVERTSLSSLRGPKPPLTSNVRPSSAQSLWHRLIFFAGSLVPFKDAELQ